MPTPLRLTDDEADALRRRAESEGRSMQDIAKQALREYVQNHSRQDLLSRKGCLWKSPREGRGADALLDPQPRLD